MKKYSEKAVENFKYGYNCAQSVFLAFAEDFGIDKEIALKWLNNGATPTDTVRDILSKEGILKEFHETKMAKKSNKEGK